MEEKKERLTLLQKLGAKEANPIIALKTTDQITNILFDVHDGKYRTMQDLKDANIDVETIFAGNYQAKNKLVSMLQSWERKENFRESQKEDGIDR